MVQEVGGEALLPPNVVDLAAPAEDAWADAYFYKLSDDKQSWLAEKKPTTAEECVAFGAISHTSRSMRDECLRRLFMKLVEADNENYVITRGNDLSWTVEPTPEKSDEEQTADRISELKQKLVETDYIAVKIAEGVATKEEYADVLAQRQAWREEINQLEGAS